MKCQFLYGLFIVLFVTITFGTDLYVSPTGSDDAEGTPGAPLATLEKARDKADELKSAGPVTVFLMEGTYYLDEPVVFGPSNSGTANAPVTYKGCSKKTVISGGIKVTSDWAASSGSVMKTTIATNLKVDQLFLNGKRQIMARYPNYNEGQLLQGSSRDALAKAGQCENPAEGPGYIRALHESMWGGQSYIITGKTAGGVDYEWVGDNNRGKTMHGQYRMIENIYELLDAEGEWFYRKSTGELFFWPPSGTDLNSSTIELATLTELIRFVGSGNSSEESVRYIQFDNLTFTHTYRSQFDGTGDFFEKVTKSDWGIVRKGTVFMQNAEHITIKNCLFDQVGGNAVFLSGYNRNHVIYENAIEEAGASGICLFGLRSSLRCPNTWASNRPACNDREPGPLTNEYPAFIKIEENLMHRIGRFEKQTAGITGSATEFDTIRHNTIHDIPRAGVNFCDGSWGGHLIEYNWVYDCVKESGDHGPFNAWGRDRNEQFGEQDINASKLDARSVTTIRYNRWEITPGHFGIDLDDQATNYYQTSNLCIGGGLKLQWHRYNTYVNNIITGGGNVQFHGVWSNSNHYGTRNIINGDETCLYQFCCGSDPSQIKNTAKVVWDSNVVHSTRGLPTMSDWGNCGSQKATWSQWQGAGLDSHSSTDDPMFTDPNKVWREGYKPKGDYNPKAGSPALKLGFVPFPMDSFGVMGVPGPRDGMCPTTIIKPRNGGMASPKIQFVNYSNRHLVVSCNDDYQVAIISASGRTISRFTGKGHAKFVLDARQIGSGVYIASVQTKNGVLHRRFFIGK